jgi:hypothetical protein
MEPTGRRDNLDKSAADEMHYLELVAFPKRRAFPTGAGDDRAVVLDGDAVAFQAENGDEIGQPGVGSEFGKGAAFPIDNHLHLWSDYHLSADYHSGQMVIRSEHPRRGDASVFNSGEPGGSVDGRETV